MTALPSPPREAGRRSVAAALASLRANAAALARLALPMIVSRAGLAALGIADAVMVSRYDPAQFAMLSLADGTLGRVSDVFAAFVLGGLILVPRAFGAGDLRECARIWRRSLVPALGLGALAALLGLCAAPLFRVLGQGAELASGGGAVAAILGLGKIAALPALGAAVFLEGIKRPSVVAASVVGANLLNVALNALLIGGGFAGLPALGARGSAVSTALVSCALALVLGGAAARSARGGAGVDRAAAAAPSSPGTQQRLGLASALVGGIMLALTASLTVFAGRLGPLALAVLAAAFTLNSPVMLVVLGIGDATGIRVAERDGGGGEAAVAPAPLKGVVGTSVAVVLAVTLLCAAVWAACPRLLAAAFSPEPAMRSALAAVVPEAGLLVVCDGLCFVFVTALRALRDIFWPTAIEIGTMAALVPLAYALAFARSDGVRGLLAAAIATAALRAALLGVRLARVANPAVRARIAHA